MRGRVQGALVLGAGLAAAHLAASGAYLAYLKPAMRFPLLAAGMVMVLLGTLTLALALVPGGAPDGGPPDDGAGEHGGHGGHGNPRVAWLLALPLLALVLVDPPALGADAARRDAGDATPVAARDRPFGPLPAPRDGAVDLTLGEFVARAYFDDGDSLAGTPVRLTGFVVRNPDIDGGYDLTRFAMACCAGDALPFRVTVRGLDGVPPPDDTWLEVVGEWIPPADPDASGARRGAALSLTAQTEIPAPTFPYE